MDTAAIAEAEKKIGNKSHLGRKETALCIFFWVNGRLVSSCIDWMAYYLKSLRIPSILRPARVIVKQKKIMDIVIPHKCFLLAYRCVTV